MMQPTYLAAVEAFETEQRRFEALSPMQKAYERWCRLYDRIERAIDRFRSQYTEGREHLQTIVENPAAHPENKKYFIERLAKGDIDEIPEIRELNRYLNKIWKHVNRFENVHGKWRTHQNGETYWISWTHKQNLADEEARVKDTIDSIVTTDTSHGLLERDGIVFKVLYDDGKALGRRTSKSVKEEAIEIGHEFYRQHEGLAERDPVYKIVKKASNLWIGEYVDKEGRIAQSEVCDTKRRLQRRQMGEQEYNAILDRTHEPIRKIIEAAAKAQNLKPEEMEKRAINCVIEEFVDPMNPVEQRPTILFGDSVEYRTEMKKLAERFGGNI